MGRPRRRLLRSCWILWFPGRVLSSLLLATGGIVFSFFEEGTDFYVILSLSPQTARRSKSEQSQKTDKYGKASSCGREGQHRGVPEAPDRGCEIHEGSPRTQAVSHDDLNKGQLPGFGREAWLRGVLPPPPPGPFFFPGHSKG